MGLLVNATVHGYRSVYCKIWVLMNAFRQRFALNAQIVNSANSVHRGRQNLLPFFISTYLAFNL